MAENWKTGEFAGKVIDVADLTELLAVFGMMAGTDPLADRDYVRLQMSHALLGVVEAHATRAEDAYRTAQADTDPREVSADLTQASLMTFAGANCQSPVDELAVIMWRATRLAGAIASCSPKRPATQPRAAATTTSCSAPSAWSPPHCPGWPPRPPPPRTRTGPPGNQPWPGRPSSRQPWHCRKPPRKSTRSARRAN